MPIYQKRTAILAKAETTYGVAPTFAALDAMLVRNVTLTPVNLEYADRELLRPSFGNFDKLVAGRSAMVEFEVELAGAGSAGTVPRYADLLRACALSQTVSAGTSVTYEPVSTAIGSVAIVVNMDGVQQRLLGCRGNVTVDLSKGNVPVLKFMMTGLYSELTDTVLPTVDYTGFQRPLVPNVANTATFTLHGTTAAQSAKTDFNMDLANQVVSRNLIGYEGVEITDRKTSGAATFEFTPVATRNWVRVTEQATIGALSVIHGTTAGNIIEISAPRVQLTEPKFSAVDDVVMMSTNLLFLPNLGNDEFSIIVR